MSIELDKLQSAISEPDDVLNQKYLTAWIDGQLMGVSIAHVVQIVGMQRITPIPEFPDYAKGVINLRGSILPVIDMRLRLGKVETEYTDRTCIIIAGIQDCFYGFVVDRVEEVLDITEEQIMPPPKLSGADDNLYLTGLAEVGGKIVLILDISSLLEEQEFAALSQAVPAV